MQERKFDQEVSHPLVFPAAYSVFRAVPFPGGERSGSLPKADNAGDMTPVSLHFIISPVFGS